MVELFTKIRHHHRRVHSHGNLISLSTGWTHSSVRRRPRDGPWGSMAIGSGVDASSRSVGIGISLLCSVWYTGRVREIERRAESEKVGRGSLNISTAVHMRCLPYAHSQLPLAYFCV